MKLFQINVKGQYSIINVNHADYTNPTDSTLTYTYKNHTTTSFIQASARPMFATNKIVRNFELASRYGNLTTPINSLAGSKSAAFAIGLDYWLNWRTVLKFTYQTIKTTDTGNKDIGAFPRTLTRSNSFYLQFSVQL